MVKVMVIDDDGDLLEAYRLAITTSGHEVQA